MSKVTITGTERHALLLTDPGLRLFREYDADGNILKEISTLGNLAYDAWKLPDGTYVYCFNSPNEKHGVIHCDANGKILTEYRTEAQIFGCQPLPGGYILAGELNTAQLVEIDPSGTVVKTVPLTTVKKCHNTLRMVRKAEDGTYLVNQPEDKVIRRYSDKGEILSEITTPGDTFAVVPDGKGNIYFTAKCELYLKRESDDTLLWHVSEEELAQIHPCWLTGMELLNNGNLLVVNWLGHGMAGVGAPVFEITPEKKIIWEFRAPEISDCIANVQSLDEDAADIIRLIKK